MASCSSSHLSEEEIRCPICLEVFNEPVSIPCGHTFCKVCISSAWDSTILCRCPLCKHLYVRKPMLQVNISFRVLVEHVKKWSRNSPARPGDVSCDVCTGRKRKALKSCLGCLASYCETHLSPHLRVPAFKKHKLIHPVENLEDRMCATHVRMLEFFCRTDQTFICAMCLNTDHKTHDAVSFEEECGQQKAELGKLMADIDKIKKTLCLKVQEIKTWVETRERDTAWVDVDVFGAQSMLFQEIDDARTACFLEAEGFIKYLENEITELTKGSSELEKLSLTEDHLYFLQTFPSLCTPPHTKDWSRINFQSDLSVVGMVRKIVSELADTLNTAMEKLKNGFAR